MYKCWSLCFRKVIVKEVQQITNFGWYLLDVFYGFLLKWSLSQYGLRNLTWKSTIFFHLELLNKQKRCWRVIFSKAKILSSQKTLLGKNVSKKFKIEEKTLQKYILNRVLAQRLLLVKKKMTGLMIDKTLWFWSIHEFFIFYMLHYTIVYFV